MSPVIQVNEKDLFQLRGLVRKDLMKQLNRAAVQELERQAGDRPPLTGSDANLFRAEKTRELLEKIEEAID